MAQLNQFRVDNHDFDKALEILKKYAAKYQASYLIVKEFGKESGKQHLQGWVKHNATDNTYRTAFSRHYKELGTHEKCFTKVKEPDVYFSYIISNDSKPHISSISDTNIITNYTQDNLDELKKLKPFVVPRTHKDKKFRSDDWYELTLQYLEEKCVKDGKIDYMQLPVYFEHKKPKSVNFAAVYDKLVGMGLRLEDKYMAEGNTRFRDEYFSKMYTLGKNIFY